MICDICERPIYRGQDIVATDDDKAVHSVCVDRLERELRLDEERIADEMEWHNVRGITAPDW